MTEFLEKTNNNKNITKKNSKKLSLFPVPFCSSPCFKIWSMFESGFLIIVIAVVFITAVLVLVVVILVGVAYLMDTNTLKYSMEISITNMLHVLWLSCRLVHWHEMTMEYQHPHSSIQ